VDADDSLRERVERSLDKVRPSLIADGGDVRFVRIRGDGIVELQWLGVCATCPMSVMTLRAGIERVVMNDSPEIRRVEAVVA
jgi:Fe-S cluster biogenesis protein NfuA